MKSPSLDLHDEQLNEKPVGDEVGEMRNEVPNVPDLVPDQPQNEKEDNEEQPLPRANRNRKPPERYGNPYTFSTTQQEETVGEPKTYEEAVNSSKAKYWKQAMQGEVDSLENNKTWTFVDKKPQDKNVLPGRWVYKVNYSADGDVDKYKARYVAKGFAQVEGLDFFETYAPTCKPETFRTLLAVATQKGSELRQMDVKSAYLH